MSGGMRWGAGRPRERRSVDDHLSLDVRRLARDGLLAAPGKWQWKWDRPGGPAAAISARNTPELDAVVFSWIQVYGAGEELKVAVRVPIERMACHLGGHRLWFRCPDCLRRCARLFVRSGGFGCRACLHLVYPSQREDAMQRSHRRTHNIEQRLGIARGAPKKRLRIVTKKRLIARLADEEILRGRIFRVVAARLLSKLPPDDPLRDDLLRE